MSLFDNIKSVLKAATGVTGASAEAKSVLGEIAKEAEARSAESDRIKLSGLPSWERLKSGDEELQMEMAVEATLGVNLRLSYRWFHEDLRRTVGSQLLRRNLPFREEHLTPLLHAAAKQPQLEYGLPLGTILAPIERFCSGKPPEGTVKTALKVLRKRISSEAPSAPS